MLLQVVEKLSSEQFHVAALHGRLPQASRTAAIDAFKNGKLSSSQGYKAPYCLYFATCSGMVIIGRGM